VVLGDVAERAGVSTASVSRVLNSPEKVSPTIRARVENAIKELGYIPDGAAQALASRRSRIVGAIVPTLDNAIFAQGINALQRGLKQRGYTLLIACSEYDLTEELHEAQAMIQRGVEGIMLVGEAHQPALYQLLDGKRIPFVNCWVFNASAKHSCIGFDNHGAARRVTEYLLDLGHREIAMVAGVTTGNDRASARVDGFRAGLAARGLSLPSERLVERRYAIGEGREALRILLRERNAPTAIVCGNDVLAYGVLLECQSAGIAVPSELSITGFDDLPLSAHLQPALTTVHVPSEEMGTLAAEFLVSKFTGQTAVVHKEVEISLVVRGTTSPPRAANRVGRNTDSRPDRA
jgi:LacI family transcriptional regulator